MGDHVVTIGQPELNQIGEYVQANLPRWLDTAGFRTPERDIDLIERTVRLEEALKNQFELMKQGFDLMEKRFEQIDKRFEQVDKRFNSMQWLIGIGFTLLTIVMTAYRFFQ
jgi:hypothetical protein